MSLVVQSFTGGTVLPSGSASPVTAGTVATAAGALAAANGTTASTLPFAQTLTQTMGGAAAAVATVPLTADLVSLLQGLLHTVQNTGEETADKATADSSVLDELTVKLEQLDEAISSDPAILAALQSWLLQVTSLLSSGSTPTETESSGAAPTLSPLAENPETLRFAVQDELHSLATLIQTAGQEGKTDVVEQGIRLLNQFSILLEQSLPAEATIKTSQPQMAASPAVMAEQSLMVPAKPKDQAAPVHTTRFAQVPVVTNATAAAPVDAAVVSTSAETELQVSTAAKAGMALEGLKVTETSLEAVPEATTGAQEHEVVTAGQLSLRGGITAPMKAEAPQVPVQQFAQEMTGFITGKLEIVRQGGLAEATISLFPENLGQVDVKITMQNGHLIAQFVTEHAAAKDMLDQQMNQLRAALVSQGLQVEKLEVTQNNTPLQSQSGQDGRQAGAGAGQQQSQSDRRSKERGEEAGDAVLAAELNGEWRDWVSGAGQEHGNDGGTFSAKA
ncbi:flagellar hook-length control protein FliK [Paenibacillus donghaensis]|nr:flagellar hook-length control protein FliK [Paenibacillus donghaensis]